MFKHWLLSSLLFCAVVACATARAQGPCPPGVASDKLVCLIPQVYGPNGLIVQANTSALGGFSSAFLGTSFRPLNSAVAKEAILLPLASPSTGTIYAWSPSGELVSYTDSLGPIFNDRAETIGKHRAFVGFDYQHFKFGTIDGTDLKKVPVVLPQADFVLSDGTTCSINASDANPPPPSTIPSRIGDCSFIRDVIKTTNRLDLKIHQFTTFLTFGLTDQIDVSIAIPIEDIRMGIFSNATIVHNGDPTQFEHAFPPRPDCHPPCLESSFSNVGTASGIGDMTLRIKGTVWKSKPKGDDTENPQQKPQGEKAGQTPNKGGRAALAFGVDIRVPTGDQLNFLGGGAAGVKPFVIWSLRSRISPHVFAGFETNGSSLIAGDISTRSNDRLPSQMTYAAGADVWITKKVTAAFDLLGSQVFQARRTSVTTFTEPGACQDLTCSTVGPSSIDHNLSQLTGNYNDTNASVGVKVKPFSTLLITGNLLIKMNEGGLRATAVPLVGISYSF